jgi:hypothetical protein
MHSIKPHPIGSLEWFKKPKKVGKAKIPLTSPSELGLALNEISIGEIIER